MGVRLLLATILAAVCAAAADAAIIVQHGIAGVSIGMSQAKVRSILGTPTKVLHKKNAFGRYVEYLYPRLVLDFQGPGPLSNVATTRRTERTGKGVGVGSTRLRVKAKVRGARCNTAICTVGKLLPGRIVTTFYLRKGVVVRVSVGRVLD